MMNHLAADVADVVRGDVRGEPDYFEQVPRLASYRHAHPDAEIIYLGSWWQYLLTEENGITVIVRFTLGELLDKLDKLDSLDAEPQAAVSTEEK